MANKIDSKPPTPNTSPLYEPLDWLMVRSPALPAAAAQNLDDIAGVVASNSVNRALAVGAPNLVLAMERDGLSNEKVENKVRRYLRRMATRPTPFGLFAGVGIAQWSTRTTLSIGSLLGRTRPSMDLLASVVDDLERDAAIVRQTHVIANPANLRRAGRLFVWGKRDDARGEYSVRCTEPVVAAVDAAAQSIAFSELESYLSTVFRVSRAKAGELLIALVRTKILLTDLKPPLTTADPVRYLHDKLSALSSKPSQLDLLQRLIAECRAFDDAREADGRDFGELVRTARSLASAVESTPLQVDAVVPLNASEVNAAVGLKAAGIAETLLRLSPVPDGPRWLGTLRETFIRRHGIAKDIPLEQFLSEISVDDFFDEGPALQHPRDATLIRLAAHCLQTRSVSIELDEDLLDRLQTWAPRPETALPSLELAVSVQAASVEDLDAGLATIIVAPIVGSRKAGRMAARFADIVDLESRFRQLSDLERARCDDEPLFAELVYEPEERKMRNVVARSAVHDHEITINTLSSLAADKVIKLSDLLLGIRNGRLAIFRARDGRRVIPCASHMLNTLNAPPIVRFLSELPFDGLPVLSVFSWGAAEAFPMLPRVTWNGAILRVAQWKPNARNIRTAADVQQWRETWRVPRRVYMSHLDNWLWVDLDDSSQVSDIIAEAGKTDATLAFQEAVPDVDDAWVPSANGRHHAEFVIPLIKRQTKTGSGPNIQRGGSNYISVPSRQRFKFPGSDWLYIHVYAGLADHAWIIGERVREFVRGCVEDKVADSWFFVRYADPEPHIRVRLHGQPEMLSQLGLPRLCEWADAMIEARACTRVCLETYDREIERYGGLASIELCEQIFAADSIAVCRLLSRGMGGMAGVDALELAVATADSLLASLGLGADARMDWFERRDARDPLIGEEFRRRKNMLRHALSKPHGGAINVAEPLGARDEAVRQATESLVCLHDGGRLTVELDELRGHIMHMHLNRLLGPNSQLERMVIGLAARTRRSLAKH